MENSILEVKNIVKKFRNRIAVDNISFTVSKGDVFGFLGPNGAGKTTTIRLILGLLQPDKGDIFINNLSIKNNFYAAVSKVGALVEGPAFYEYMTAEENLECFGAYSENVSKTDIWKCLELVGLSKRAKDKVKEYSFGMKQRLGIAQALLHDPDILVLDEPINGLDPQGIREIRDIINELRNQGKTIFLSSHILSEVENVCNKILIIKDGKEVISGKTKELVNTSNTYDIQSVDNEMLAQILQNIKEVSIIDIKDKIRVQLKKELQPEDLLKQLINNNVKIRVYNPVNLSLEEYFFSALKGD